MKLLSIKSEIYSRTYDQLDDTERLLLYEARMAMKLSYSPYSKFQVGCAILMENGSFVRGANQENAAFPACICAEGVALSASAIQHPFVKIQKIAILSNTQNNTIVSPCGLCRQNMLEYENRHQRPFEYYLASVDEVYYFTGISNILPLAFQSF